MGCEFSLLICLWGLWAWGAEGGLIERQVVAL